MAFKTETFSAINVYTSVSGKRSIVIVFPPAGKVHEDYREFLSVLANEHDVLFVESGYFGCKKQAGKEILYDSREFTRRFFLRYKAMLATYSTTAIIGQSYGSIQGLKLAKKMPAVKLILISPPLSSAKFRHERWGKPLLKLLVTSQIGRKVLEAFDGGKLTALSRYIPFPVIKQAQETMELSGGYSYFRCLYEILNEGVVTDGDIDERTILIIGKNDASLNAFCLQAPLRRRKHTFVIDADHDILQEKWHTVAAMLREA